MIVPTPTPFSAIPNGGVFSNDAAIWYIKSDPSTAVRLDNGAVVSGMVPAGMWTYFPTATLSFG